MKLLERMRNQEEFTDGEFLVVQYLLNHPSENLTIAELADLTYTSNSTIIRMCRKLGFDGYRAFRLEFIKEMESYKYVSEQVDYDNPFNAMEGTHEIICKITNLYRESTDLLFQCINEKKIERISQTIFNARRIYVYAIGDSMITARAFANKLQKLGIYPILANKNNEDITASYNAEKEDCVIFLSYSMRLPDFLKAYKMLYKKRVPVIAITANEKHCITKNATHKIIIPNKETDFSIATFYSQFAFEYVLNILYSSIYALNYNYHKERKHDIDSIRTC